jgi:hypothetical protein
VGPAVAEKPLLILKVSLEEGDWKETATPLAEKLLKLKGVSKATIGEKGNITLEYNGTAPAEEEVKKLVSTAGMKFISMAAPE